MRSPTLEFGRLTNLADGIFSVAMTFLAFTIHLPVVVAGPYGGLPARLVELLPQFLTLALSFAFAGRCWVLHYRMHSVIPRGDEWLLILNLCLLLHRPDPVQRLCARQFPAVATERVGLCGQWHVHLDDAGDDVGLCAGASAYAAHRRGATAGTLLCDALHHGDARLRGVDRRGAG